MEMTSTLHFSFNLAILLDFFFHVCMHTCSVIQLCLFATLWPAACQAPLSMGFSKQEYWASCHFPHRGSSQPGDRTWVSCTGGRSIYLYPEICPYIYMSIYVCVCVCVYTNHIYIYK